MMFFFLLWNLFYVAGPVLIFGLAQAASLTPVVTWDNPLLKLPLIGMILFEILKWGPMWYRYIYSKEKTRFWGKWDHIQRKCVPDHNEPKTITF